MNNSVSASTSEACTPERHKPFSLRSVITRAYSYNKAHSPKKEDQVMSSCVKKDSFKSRIPTMMIS